MPDQKAKATLNDIGTEELAHLEMVGTIVHQLTKGLCPEKLWMPRPSLEVFKAGLDGALGSLGCYETWRLVALIAAAGLELHEPRGPFQPGPLCDPPLFLPSSTQMDGKWKRRAHAATG